MSVAEPASPTEPQRASRRRAPPPLEATDALFLDIDGTLADLAHAPDASDRRRAGVPRSPGLHARWGARWR